MSAKKNLPEKYAKMTVCTYWVLHQLKTTGVLSDDQMNDAVRAFHLTDCIEDQMLHYNDLVENFDEHKTNLKSYAKSKTLEKETEETKNSNAKKQKKAPKTSTDDMDIIAQIIQEHSHNVTTNAKNNANSNKIKTKTGAKKIIIKRSVSI